MTDGIDVNTTFLNVDLELRSNRDLQPLIDALGRRIVVLHSETVNGRSWARIELARQPKTPAAAITRFGELIDDLPPRPRLVWERASVKDFDIGIQAGIQPHDARWVLSPPVLRTVQRLGATLSITVYASTASSLQPPASST